MPSESLIPPHGGYKKLRTCKLGNLIYDATAAFCEQYYDRKDRTYDQMVQAARSGVANIIEGSEASATSKKTELKLTNVAKASQEELLSDYQSFLRQRGLPEWSANSPAAQMVRRARPETLDQLRQLMAVLVADPTWGEKQTDAIGARDHRTCPTRPTESAKNETGPARAKVLRKAEVAGNVMICLINQETYLLGRQIARLAADFEQNGGFTERLYRIRSEIRKKQNDQREN
ncbi:MAG: four helix bundle suffix domain-containing protein [Lentisphaeria bacterium]|nr:four helix bundle suffix domain-containing protein [Lentisphaeria bacterium]